MENLELMGIILNSIRMLEIGISSGDIRREYNIFSTRSLTILSNLNTIMEFKTVYCDRKSVIFVGTASFRKFNTNDLSHLNEKRLICYILVRFK